jgi:hypothetical protein
VGLSDGRQDRGLETQAVGSTVDVERATYLNPIGDPVLAAVRQDPDFDPGDPGEPAFHYCHPHESVSGFWKRPGAN